MYFTFDIGFNAVFPKARVNTLVRKAYEVIEHLRADRALKLIDVYHEYVFRPEDEHADELDVQLDLLGIGESEISVLETRNHLIESLGEILGVESIRWYDNSTVVRKMSVEAEEFWREKYGFLPCSTGDTQSLDKEKEQVEAIESTGLIDSEPAKNIDALKEVAAESELMNMPGLKDAKNKITRIIASRQLSLMRSKMGFKSMKSCHHLCFMGNPGTAKTTVARLLKDILFARGILSNDVFIECGRADLVGEHIGETAQLVRKKFDEAMGGILFIDEAYSLIGYGNDFGREAITTIVQEMENRRDDVMVILAGYPREMEQLLDMNEGLRSRIGDKISFEDYSEDELMEIMVSMADKHSLVLSDDAKAEVRRIVAMAKTEKNFGNGRFMRQLLENGYENMALRVVKETIDKENLSLLRKCDFASLMPMQNHAKEKACKKIGFRLEMTSKKESND